MNLKTAAEILALNTSGQREYAKEIGVKRAAADTKTTLAAKLLTATLRIEKAAAAEREEIAAMKAAAKIRTKVETAARAPKTKRACTQQPCTRKVTENDMCGPHNDEAGWENTHSDSGHEAILAIVEGDRTAEQSDEIDGCWICFPELNQANAEPRKATTSKVGMVILAKGTYVHKSALVENAIEKLGGSVKITTSDDLTRLVGKLTVDGNEWTIIAEWNGNAFHYAGSSLNGGKFRNVKELFRQLGL